MSVVISSVSESLGVPVKECKSLIKSITDRFPDNEIISVRKDEDNFIFSLFGDIVVKFLPPYNYPIFELPRGLSRYNSSDLAFNLYSHFDKNKQHLFTAKNLNLLKQVSVEYKTKNEQTHVYSQIAKAFGIPNAQWRTPALLTTLVKKIPSVVGRVMLIDDKKIVVGLKVKLKGDKSPFRMVRKISPDFYLQLSSVSGNVDPKDVTLL